MAASGDGQTASNIGVVIVHGVADAEQGYNLKVLVDTLEARSRGRLAADPYREVYEQHEPSLISEKTSPNPFFVRRAMLDGHRRVTFAEAFWADTTRVATGKGTALAAAFRIVFEMHYFINALVPWNSANVLAKPLIVLLHAAAGLIRGPIVGFNAVLLSVGTVYLSGQAIATLAGRPDFDFVTLHRAVFGVCAFVLLASTYYLLKNAGVRLKRAGTSWLWMPRVTNDIDPVPLEVWLFTALTAFAACVYVARIPSDAAVCDYGKEIFDLLICVWRVLSLLVVLASAVAVFLTIWPPYKGQRRSLWAAIGIVILQAVLWALFIAIPGILLIGLFEMAKIDICTVSSVKYDLAVNFIALIFLGALGGLVMLVRGIVAARAGKPEPDGSARRAALADVARRMPRLIVSPVMLAAIVIGGLASGIVAVIGHDYAGGISGSQTLSIAFAVLIFLVTLTLYSILDTKAFVNIVHIARDLIDHQYAPRLSLAWVLRPRLMANSPSHPRRTRLLMRVEAALEFLKRDRCEIILFVAHSQGTIIVYEHFREAERVAGVAVDKVRFAADKTGVVTFGSPLEHLYAHYFHDYAQLEDKLDSHRRDIASWDNLYRIDDPIGNRIDDSRKWIANIAMEKGGHTNYWIEIPVADAILAAIGRLMAPGNPSAPRP